MKVGTWLALTVRSEIGDLRAVSRIKSKGKTRVKQTAKKYSWNGTLTKDKKRVSRSQNHQKFLIAD